MRDMKSQTQDTVAALSGAIADLTAVDEGVSALRSIVESEHALLDAITNTIVAASSIIACVPGNAYVTGFASDVIEAAHAALGEVEKIDKATDTLLAPLRQKYEGVAFSVKAGA